MSKKFLLDTLGWGFLLWLLGYGLGILLFIMVPPSLIGWIITPIGTAATLFVLFLNQNTSQLAAGMNGSQKNFPGGILRSLLRSSSFKKIQGNFNHYLAVAISWTIIAIVFDYFFLVQAFKPADGYYKFDVYLYYALIFTLPLIVGWFKSRKKLLSN